MDGVTILNSFKQFDVITIYIVHSLLALLIGLVAIDFFHSCYIGWDSGDVIKTVVLFLLTTVTCIFSIFFTVYNNNMRYEVKIADSVSINEFNEKYKIIEYDNAHDTYIVELKEK